MFAQRRASITADEEERQRRGYEITLHYQPGGRTTSYTIQSNGETRFRLEHEHEGQVMMVNRGLREIDNEPQGFTICRRCFAWLLSPEAERKHISTTGARGECPQNAHVEDLGGVWLTHQLQSDLLFFDVPLVEGIDGNVFYTTLLHTLQRALMIAFQMDESEIDGFLLPNPANPDHQRIVLFETSLGGSGVLASLCETGRLTTLFTRAKELLHENDPEGGCERACYDCLLSFYNQRDHHLMDRLPVLSWMQSFGELDIQSEQADFAERFNPLYAACQSGLERDILQAFADRGIRLPDSGQYIINDPNGCPLAIADFYYDPRIIVFVDGSPHYLDYVQAGDDRKRRRLMSLGYRVVAIRGDAIEEDLQALIDRVLENPIFLSSKLSSVP